MLLTLSLLGLIVVLLLITEKIATSNRAVKTISFHLYAAICKLIASSLFVFYFYYFSPPLNLFGYWILFAFLFSWLGDALLLVKSKSRYFIYGIGAFALAHLSFSFGYTQLPINFRITLITGIICLIAATSIYFWLRPNLTKHYKIMVPSYLLIISVMLTLGFSSGLYNHNYWLAAGSLIFAISDLFVARNRFIQAAYINRLIGLPLYYLAQVMLGYGAIQLIPIN